MGPGPNMPGRTTTLAGSRNGPQPPRGGGDTWTSTWTGVTPFLDQNDENVKKKLMSTLSLLVFIIEFEFNSILCILSERLRKCQRTFSFSRFLKKMKLRI